MPGRNEKVQFGLAKFILNNSAIWLINTKPQNLQMHCIISPEVCPALLSAAERRGTPVLLSASVSDNFGNSPQIAAPRRSREINQSTQRFYFGWFHVGWQGTGDQSDAVSQNAWFRCALCAAISGEISILLQTGADSWGRFPVPRICRWESSPAHVVIQ